ncbi:MAG: 5-(carboxyamino)imidazole ribonucleotide mutase [Nitrospinae bacterium]|nr:5-(carboxyamino)imidazole ribonucleotide mutase [Nitrospinota bacterium]
MTATAGVVMGSDSDWTVMQETVQILDFFEIPREVVVASAHRSPERTFAYAREAAGRGLKVLIAGAGGAAHLAGVLASATTLPVIGVPIDSPPLQGLDALLATVQMPGGVPVATVAIGKNGARNAGILAAQILALSDPALTERLRAYRAQLAAEVEKTSERLAAQARRS